MRPLLPLLVPCCLALLLVGCKADSVPPTPALPESAALRPVYQIGDGPPSASGTAFVILDRAGRAYMLTAAHVMDAADWPKVESATLRLMTGGVEVARCEGRPAYVGTEFSD